MIQILNKPFKGNKPKLNGLYLILILDLMYSKITSMAFAADSGALNSTKAKPLIHIPSLNLGNETYATEP